MFSHLTTFEHFLLALAMVEMIVAGGILVAIFRKCLTGFYDGETE